MDKMTTRELNPVIPPNGTLHLEWMDTEDAVTKGSAMVKKEISDRYSDKSAARLFLGDTRISEEEARRLLAESDGLAFIKNRWVAVDREKGVYIPA